MASPVLGGGLGEVLRLKRLRPDGNPRTLAHEAQVSNGVDRLSGSALVKLLNAGSNRGEYGGFHRTDIPSLIVRSRSVSELIEKHSPVNGNRTPSVPAESQLTLVLATTPHMLREELPALMQNAAGAGIAKPPPADLRYADESAVAVGDSAGCNTILGMT